MCCYRGCYFALVCSAVLASTAGARTGLGQLGRPHSLLARRVSAISRTGADVCIPGVLRSENESQAEIFRAHDGPVWDVMYHPLGEELHVLSRDCGAFQCFFLLNSLLCWCRAHAGVVQPGPHNKVI